MVAIGRSVYRITSIMSSHLRYKIYCIHNMSETITCLNQLSCLVVRHLLLLPWCTAITGYWVSSNYSNCQQKTNWWLATNKQAKCYQAYCSMHKKWFNLWLYHWCSLLPIVKKYITSCAMWHLLQSIAIYWVLFHILYVNNLTLYMPPIIHNLR